jgi:2-polyprenyl-6-methoxyphenol hydroxylase-like FAD-dependent oxidoreductase
MKIACVGAGPGGLYFALLMKLRNPGYDVTVFERNSSDSTDGLGLVFWDSLLDQLCRNDPVSGSTIDEVAFRLGDQVVEISGSSTIQTGTSGYSISRSALRNVLEKRAVDLGVAIEYSHPVHNPSELSHFDLIVASDGVNSNLRGVDHLGGFGTNVDVGHNKYIWLGTTRVFDSFVFSFVPTASGWVWCAAYGMDSRSSTFVVECSAETWKGLRFDTAPAHESLAVLEGIFAHQLGGHPLTSQTRDQATVQWLNFRRITNQRWHHANVVLLGDAAHTTHFSIGSGTRLAIEDAIVLAESLSRYPETESALDSYESERKASLLRHQTEAQCSARWLENISRYVSLPPNQFFTLWKGRRSPVLARIPPQIYYRLYWASTKVPGLRVLRDKLGIRTRRLHGQLASAHLSDPSPGTGLKSEKSNEANN